MSIHIYYIVYTPIKHLYIANFFFFPFSLDHEIQKGYILGVSSTHKLENFHRYQELGPLLGFTKQVFASLRSGAVLYNGHFL